MYLIYVAVAAAVVVVIAEMFFDFFNICWFLVYYVKKSPHEHYPYFFFFFYIHQKNQTKNSERGRKCCNTGNFWWRSAWRLRCLVVVLWHEAGISKVPGSCSLTGFIELHSWTVSHVGRAKLSGPSRRTGSAMVLFVTSQLFVIPPIGAGSWYKSDIWYVDAKQDVVVFNDLGCRSK